MDLIIVPIHRVVVRITHRGVICKALTAVPGMKEVLHSFIQQLFSISHSRDCVEAMFTMVNKTDVAPVLMELTLWRER